jgi:crotonobetainyl-CoA:carnitine CoA-transferase CaiB-like acyl-CoA transferase
MADLLDGIRVLDLTVFQQGPYASSMLADLGADVIKIEGPDTPDPGRGFDLPGGNTEFHSYFQTLNRGKRGISLDLKTERGRAVLHRLVENADVFVSNVRYKALQRLGADYESLSAINPRLVYAHATGYGPEGPDADLGSMDMLGVARGGLMSVTGEPGGPPTRIGAPIGDHVGAICLGFGIMAALFHRMRTGEGQRLEGSLLAGQMVIQSHNITGALFAGKPPPRQKRGGPNPAWNIYQGSDAQWFALGMSRAKFWPGICTVIDRLEWATDERYASLESRLERRDELVGLLDEIFATKPAAEWVRLFSEANLMASMVNTYLDLGNDPQALINGYIAEVERPDGKPPVKMVGPPIIFSKTPGRIRGLAPEFGQHTEDVLREAGYSWEEIGELSAAGVIGLRNEA